MKDDYYLKVKDAADLVRDTRSTAILNTDNAALKAYKERRRRESDLNRVMEEHASMKQDIQEIKALLRQLIGQAR